ncbi:MAG: hypothetical protein AB7P76_01230 [Candidatus Melainabacteria bacterium]
MISAVSTAPTFGQLSRTQRRVGLGTAALAGAGLLTACSGTSSSSPKGPCDITFPEVVQQVQTLGPVHNIHQEYSPYMGVNDKPVYAFNVFYSVGGNDTTALEGTRVFISTSDMGEPLATALYGNISNLPGCEGHVYEGSYYRHWGHGDYQKPHSKGTHNPTPEEVIAGVQALHDQAARSPESNIEQIPVKSGFSPIEEISFALDWVQSHN